MQSKTSEGIKLILSELYGAAYMIFSAYIGMQFTGKLAFQIALTFFASLIFTVVADFLKIRMTVLSHSVCISATFWVLCAVIGQMVLKNTFLIFYSAWEYMFYYDSIGMIFIVMIVVIAYQRFKAFFKKDRFLTEQYKKFYSVSSVAFTAFYIVVLIYCFFICRIPGGERVEPNLRLFEAFRWTFLSGYLDYERMILFLGNIAIFVPLGYLLFHSLKKVKRKILLVLLPVFLSSAIEFSQYYFGMGHPDVDDVLLNVIGFYIGALLKMLLDRAFKLEE